MNNQNKDEIRDQIAKANNILVAVSKDPSVDELAASIGLTLALNKLDKHATTVYSGATPSTIEFLQPEQTIETNTDSLRDFIIALDKSKADKLRYKVEDEVVRIFITPYRTSITQDDLNFTQGDFNVDLVIGLGVERREDLDAAITAHGNILHDATVMSISNGRNNSELGSIHWQEPSASSLCEMMTVVLSELSQDLLDPQMSTALLTGIVAETDRFKNPKTSPLALSVSSQLMSAGADQQLIAEKLDEPAAVAAPPIKQEDASLAGTLGSNSAGVANDVEPAGGPHPAYAHDEQPAADGSLSISHEESTEDEAAPEAKEPEDIHIDEHGTLNLKTEQSKPAVEDQAPPKPEPKPAAPVPMPPQIASAYADTDDEPTNEESSSGYMKPDEPDTQDDTDEKSEPKDINDIPSDNAKNDEQTKPKTPIMKHERVIAPAADSELAEKAKKIHSDKPFDLGQAEETPGIVPQLQPSSPEQAASTKPAEQTLSALEQSIESPHAKDYAAPGTTTTPDIAALSAKATQAADAVAPQFPSPQEAMQGSAPIDVHSTEPPKPDTAPQDSAPPVPPPMAPQFFDSDGKPEPQA